MTYIKQLDRILRGDATDLEALRTEKLSFSVPGMALMLNMLGLIYGACMGVFAVTGSGSGAKMQIVASMVKVPALFMGTLLVTFPSLYVFNALFGSRLRFGPMLRLLLGSMAVTLAVLSSIGPIVAFFSVSSTSYAFMVLLNVAVFAAAGIFGLGFLLQTLKKLRTADLMEAQAEADAQYAAAQAAAAARAAETPVYDAEGRPIVPRLVRPVPVQPRIGAIFRVWVVIFGLVGTQMAWVLRPFIGHPHAQFTWFRPRGGNFFEAVSSQIQHFTKNW